MFAIWTVTLLRNSICQLPTPVIWQCIKSHQGENLILITACMEHVSLNLEVHTTLYAATVYILITAPKKIII